MNKPYSLTVVISLVTLLAACSPTGQDVTHVEMKDLVGLWNSSEAVGMKQDKMYTRITSSGSIIEYDYDGDGVDQGLDCYQVNTGTLKRVDGNHYIVTTDMLVTKQFDVELEWLDAGNALKVYVLDTNDQDGDGDVTETIDSQIWTREADDSILDNEPSCKDQVE